MTRPSGKVIDEVHALDPALLRDIRLAENVSEKA